MYYKITIKKRSFSLLLFCFILGLLPLKTTAQQISQGDPLNDETRRKFDYYFYAALNAKALGKYDEGIDLFQYCYALDSTNANVLVELGTFYNVLQEKIKRWTFFGKLFITTKPIIITI
jgi:hypothetical protein